MKPEVKLQMSVYGDRAELKINERERFSFEASLACQFLEKWGMAMATEDGEDSAGRSRLRTMSPAEAVQRAFDMAQLACEEARKRGQVVLLPTLAEIEALEAAAKEAKKAKAAA
jgi:hypothetical protein